MTRRDDWRVILVFECRTSEIDQADIGILENCAWFGASFLFLSAFYHAAIARIGNHTLGPDNLDSLDTSKIFSGFKSVWTSFNRWRTAPQLCDPTQVGNLQSTLLSRLFAKSCICLSGNGEKPFCLRKSKTLIPYSSETIQGWLRWSKYSSRWIQWLAISVNAITWKRKSGDSLWICWIVPP
jgi:hypothetical protein